MIIEENNVFLSDNLKTELSKIPDSEQDYKISKDDKKIPVLNNTVLHSVYYPLKECDRYDFPEDNGLLCISIGFGAGYHLLKYHDKSRNILSIPVDLELLKGVLSNIDLTIYFDPDSFKLIMPEEIPEYFDIYKYNGYFFIIHQVLQRLYGDRVLGIINTIKKYLNPYLLENNTIKKFGFIWHKNILKNIKFFFEGCYDFSPFVIDKPVLIAGAGPSLEQNIAQIIPARNEFHIASADTALKILFKHGIIPDSVFTFDAQNYSYLHFTDNIPVRIFSDFSSPVRIPGKKQTIVFSNHPFASVFFDCGFSPIMLSSSSRNIGGAIIDFFGKFFPENPVLSAGIDFGYYEYSSYSKGSYISDHFLINSTYINPVENMDYNFFHQLPVLNSREKWKTTGLLSDYSINSRKDIHSLSDSPFCHFKRTNIDEFLNSHNPITKSRLLFDKPEITIDEFFERLSNNVRKNINLMYPFFLFYGKKPDEKDINDLLKDIRNFFQLN